VNAIESKGVWAKHYQAFWEGLAANPDVPMFARVFSLAYGCHKSNGHASFEPGQMAATLLVRRDAGMTECDRSTLYRAIKTAVKYGYLAEGSCERCLIVPAEGISLPLGEYTRCGYHSTKQEKKYLPVV
jgi:hypothetical protein